MSLVVIGLNHRTSPVELRERFAFEEDKIPAALQFLSDHGLAGEAVIVSTCNRVEIYAVTPLEPNTAFRELKQFLVHHGFAADAAAGGNSSPAELGDAIYTLNEPQSLHHLFRVASGLDSMVVGETEIFGQLKKAYELALQNQRTGAWLNRAFQRAFNVAKHIRTTTNIQRGSVSVMSVAVELAEKIFTSLHQHEVLVIGAGETSEKTARALMSRGARGVVVTNRSPERAEALAAELGGRTVPYDRWPEEFEKIDIAISSTSAPDFVLDRARLEPLMKRRKHRPLLLIDIAVPRDIDPAVNALDNVYLYNVDDLQGIAEDYLKLRHDEILRCEKIILEKVTTLLESVRSPLPPKQSGTVPT
jgi:glutamyl-tRNA reductase